MARQVDVTRREGRRSRLAAAALLLSLAAGLSGCAVVGVASAAAGAAISVTGAVVSTGVKVTGKVVGKAIDAATPAKPNDTSTSP